MTEKEVIRMILEATGQAWVGDKKFLVFERFAALVAAHEREECAKLCDGWTHADGDVCADAIRARKE